MSEGWKRCFSLRRDLWGEEGVERFERISVVDAVRLTPCEIRELHKGVKVRICIPAMAASEDQKGMGCHLGRIGIIPDGEWARPG